MQIQTNSTRFKQGMNVSISLRGILHMLEYHFRKDYRAGCRILFNDVAVGGCNIKTKLRTIVGCFRQLFRRVSIIMYELLRSDLPLVEHR